MVFTLPAEIAQIAYWNKRAVYGLLFKASAETVMTIAADPKRMGAKVGLTSVLHTWGSAMTHHPHIHMIVPGGGLSPDGNRWVACKPGFLLHVRVLSRLFHRIRHYGLLSSGSRKTNLTKIRALLCVQPQGQADVHVQDTEPDVAPLTLREPCPCCGGPMRIIEIFRRGQKPM